MTQAIAYYDAQYLQAVRHHLLDCLDTWLRVDGEQPVDTEQALIWVAELARLQGRY